MYQRKKKTKYGSQEQNRQKLTIVRRESNKKNTQLIEDNESDSDSDEIF